MASASSRMPERADADEEITIMATFPHPAAKENIDRNRGRANYALAFACLIAMSATVHAAKRDDQIREIGDWTVTASRDGKGCFLTREYDRPGKTTLLFGLDGDGTNHLSVLNANWSIAPKDQLSLRFRLSNGGYAKHGAVGIAADGKQGFVTSFEAKFPVYFAASKVLDISRGNVPVEQLGLDGSGAAVAALRACVSLRRAPARAGEIPKDPFAPDRSKPSR